jgi:hypothetical protein
MTDRAERQRTLIAALYDATGRGDWVAAEAHLTEGFFITEAAGLPFGGVYRGRGALRALYEKVLSMLAVERLEIEATTCGGDYAVTLLSFHFARDLSPVQIAEMFRFEGDLVAEIRPYYFDPEPVRAAVRANAA